MPVNTVPGPPGFAVATIDQDVKVDIRRYMGYPAYGYGPSNYFVLGRYLDSYQQLETRMNSMTVSEYARVTYILNNLAQMEDDMFGMRNAMVVDQAAVFKRNRNEAADRHAEFRWWLRHLQTHLGVLPGPNFEGNSGANVRFIK